MVTLLIFISPSIISDLVDKALEDEEYVSTDNDIRSIFNDILKSDNIDIRDKKSVIIDFIAAGIQTLTNTISFLLYYVSKNPDCQKKILEELRHIEDSNNTESASSYIYTKACIQESSRLCPTAFCIARVLEEDMTLAGYDLPAGVCSNYKFINVFYVQNT